MNVTRPGIVSLALWLALLAFAAINVQYTNLIFNTTSRWLFLGLLFISLIVRGGMSGAFRNGFGVTLVLYMVWCFGTVLWSEVPALSLMKAIAFGVTAIAFLGGGYYWAKARNAGIMGYLLPIVVLAGFAAFSNPAPEVPLGAIQLYQGQTANPNYLGMLCAISTPFALYNLYLVHKGRAGAVAYVLSYALLALLFFVLWLTASRASVICVLMVLVGFFATLRLNGGLLVLLVVGMLGAGIGVAVPEIEQSISDRLIYKGEFSDTGSIFFSRQLVWSESYAQALKGGWFGGGYGVAIGDSNFSGELTAQYYGREKGNSQLAVWEETGLIGLALYALLIVLIVKDALSGLTAIADDRTRIQVGLLSGLLIGLLAQSIFEAWWTAPGSFESAVFWATCGVVGGLKQSRSSRHPSSVGRRTIPAFIRASN